MIRFFPFVTQKIHKNMIEISSLKKSSTSKSTRVTMHKFVLLPYGGKVGDMTRQPEDDEGQQQCSEGKDQETTRNFNIAGPYEQLITRVFDEGVRIFPVLALWMLSFAILIAPQAHKDMVRGLRAELKVIDGHLAKFVWSISAPGIAIRCHFIKKPKKIEEQKEQEQEI
jgi:hypothetical protein